MSERHRPQAVEVWPEPGQQRYRMHCDCGASGQARGDKKSAEADVAVHRAVVAPPIGQRCADARRHQMAWWDYCPLCGRQEALFSMAEVTGITGSA